MDTKEKEISIREFLSEGLPFRIRDIHPANHIPQPLRMDGGAILLCTAGRAEISINTQEYILEKTDGAILLDEVLLFIKGCTPDFRMTMFVYSKEMAFQATHKFAASFFTTLLQHPIYHHTEGSDDTLMAYFQIVRNMQSDTHNRYATLIATNILRSIMLDIYDKHQRYAASHHSSRSSSRKEELFSRFMELVIKHARKHRDVAYYADKLCISTRYLTEIAKQTTKETPKQAIDHFIVSEIKLMLTFSDMSIQQIADYMHFPDQSYLGRFFKHHTGVSPTAFRLEGMAM